MNLIERLKKNINERFYGLVLSFTFFLSVILMVIILKNLEWEKAGNLGSSIGGTVGAIVSFLAAWLVYKSFISQVKANNEISKQLNDERIFRIYEIFSNTLFDNVSLKTVVENYSVLKRDLINCFNTKTIIINIFDIAEIIQNDIKGIEYNLKNVYPLYDSFCKISDYKKDDYHRVFYNRMNEKIQPYLWFIKKPENDYEIEVPIIKIQQDINQINKFIIDNLNNNSLRVKTVSLKRDNEQNLQNIESDFTGYQNFYEIQIESIKQGEYTLEWKIEYRGKIYSYINDSDSLKII